MDQPTIRELYEAYVRFMDRSEDDIRSVAGSLSAKELETNWGRRMTEAEFRQTWQRVSRDPVLKETWLGNLFGGYDAMKLEIDTAVNELFGDTASGAPVG